jgi:nucleoside-diphosphate-sugar epimerase
MHWLSASLSLAEAFVNAGGKRAVVAGTCAEYSWKQGLCCEKETPLEPETLYGISKASLYRVLSSYASLSDLSLAWGRIFFLYGSNEPKGRLVPAVINNLLDNKEAPCSHGQQIRDFMHVQDVADAFTALLDSEIEGAVNIASGSPVTIKEVVTMIADKIDSQSKPEFGAIAANPTEPPKILAETARLKNELGWEPRYTLEQGIDETINWWSNQMAAR